MTTDLFSLLPQQENNLLPYDGIVNDYGIVFPAETADRYFAVLMRETPWRHDEAVLYGKHITTARQTAWYGDEPFAYTYSGITRRALPWTAALAAVKQVVESRLARYNPTLFNSCLLNLYSDGLEGMSWHSDDEPELGRQPVIASVSFGVPRKFAFKHKRTKEKREMMLQHGQLIVMRGDTQNHWLHAVMKSTRISGPRISLTFRTIVG
ncbi:alpha-ketoglutarate-dependent dioxygenase AlkB family protein [Neisseria animaloris]|uniref:Alpha-ketoglutarate-dependent dioxygenase AlkB n=1 Tax=Neisseria animaloris TaxID=326522 RepID=A0A448U8R9_9NEIS|nr:alpha-ketoglutarate-dependent dioxygenase AlkB [Neisseria animaloris]VEJ20312.1 Alpha-ketoglutarate-dependent dioxygenase AlkB [Neisseria animaloris]